MVVQLLQLSQLNVPSDFAQYATIWKQKPSQTNCSLETANFKTEKMVLKKLLLLGFTIS
jgi:hypothetical protein